MDRNYQCRLCGKEFTETEVADAERLAGIGAGYKGGLYRFPNNELHDLVLHDVRRRHTAHRKSKFMDCVLCNPKLNDEF